MRILALTGGIGGAKLSLGLASTYDADEVAFLVNTADDFKHYGLHISPDVDTLLYTLAGLNNPEHGWGRENETWNCLEVLGQFGGETWFQIGDKDLALHLLRQQLLAQQLTMSDVIQHLCETMGIRHKIFPMTDSFVQTMVRTTTETMEFQRYFVKERCEPVVRGFRFQGIDEAHIPSGLAQCTFDCVIICPSNPFVSIDPILSVPGMRKYLTSLDVPIVAVSPIIGGKALKGPAAKMMAELDFDATSIQIGKHYGGFIHGLMIDRLDADNKAAIEALGVKVAIEQTIMNDLEDRKSLAKSSVDFALSL